MLIFLYDWGMDGETLSNPIILRYLEQLVQFDDEFNQVDLNDSDGPLEFALETYVSGERPSFKNDKARIDLLVHLKKRESIRYFEPKLHDWADHEKVSGPPDAILKYPREVRIQILNIHPIKDLLSQALREQGKAKNREKVDWTPPVLSLGKITLRFQVGPKQSVFNLIWQNRRSPRRSGTVLTYRAIMTRLDIESEDKVRGFLKETRRQLRKKRLPIRIHTDAGVQLEVRE